MDQSEKTIGQVAYEKWADLVSMRQMRWEQMPEQSRFGWEEIALAAVNQYIMQTNER